ncbi:MAG TPA: hypothetical protein VFB82_11435, partial [Blastocatellia bacterium]|nr:hypothetical protein [Blastocatellia bacterium]
MGNNNRLNSTHESTHDGRNTKNVSRVMILSIILSVLAAGAALPSGYLTKVSAAIQKAARRTATPAPRVPRGRQSKEAQIVAQGKLNPDGSITPSQIITDQPIQRTTADIMEDQASRPVQQSARMKKPEFEHDRDNLPDRPGAIQAAQWPLPDQNAPVKQLGAPQSLGTQFDGATGPTETGAFPPDTMGAVGPTQVVVFLNGRLRTFSKTTGVADAAINADSDVFFASVVTPPLAGEVSFTSDPM